MKCIKLTDQDGYTRRGMEGETLWLPGKTLRLASTEPNLCNPGWYHFYRAQTSREAQALALLRNPCDGNINDPIAWVCVPGGEQKHQALKSGARELRIVRRLPEMPVSVEMLVEAVIRIVLAIPGRRPIPKWDEWAQKYLSGETVGGAEAAEAATWAAEAREAAAEAAAHAATWAAEEWAPNPSFIARIACQVFTRDS